jgi:mannose-6-phosphate isomerase-like protein (cupin superfamily)
LESLKKDNSLLEIDNNSEDRPWGKYEILLDSKYCKVKKITVNSGKRISYQYHKRRSEVWVIVSGNGIAMIDNEKRNVTSGDIVNIEKKEKHRIECTSRDNLVFIETQLGDYFGEDDIVRIDDDYGRS